MTRTEEALARGDPASAGHPRFDDLRAYLRAADALGMLRVVEGAHWDLEIGAIAELLCGTANDPILLFDRVVGYPPGYRVLANHLNTSRKLALARGLPLDAGPLELVRLWRERRKAYVAVPPAHVAGGAVLENVLRGDDVDLLRFPVPKWRLLDGGRYMGTGDVVITRTPEGPWVNLGTYRQSVLARDRLSIYIEPHHHGRAIAKMYWASGRPCPVAVCWGTEEAVFEASAANLAPGVSEYGYAGWLRGAPVPVISGPLTGLPIPANSEIAIEGEIPPPEEESAPEGPFREWPGYYTQAATPQPVVRVRAIYHRNDPILTGRPAQSRTISAPTIPDAAISALEALDRSGIPGVRAAWAYMQSLLIVVSIEQQYAGHARAALAAVLGARTASTSNRYFVVVDEDIDPSDIDQVLWALCTRVEPAEQIEILRGMRTGGIDPIVAPEKRAVADYTAGVVLIDACKPFTWRAEFGRSRSYAPEFLDQVRAKWGRTLGIS